MKTKRKVAVVISGCGVYDGAEIHESILTLYALSKYSAEYQVFAPDIPQFHVINHLSGEEMNEKRNVLIESARIARGNIKALDEYKADDFDAIIFTGGYGVAKNLSSWAFKGHESMLEPEVERCIKETIKSGKPIGAMCIAPVLLAKILPGVEITLGSNNSDAESVLKTGAIHKDSNHGELVIDRKYKIVSTPCYMLDASIAQIGEGTDNLVKTILKMVQV
jgi:enhancing lycopene biosynthesis protein 2